MLNQLKIMKTFYIYNCLRYCARISIDCQRIYNYLVANGFIFNKNFSKADLIIISTCGLTKNTENDSIKAIRYYIKNKSELRKLIIFGCVPEVNPELLDREFGEFEKVTRKESDKFDDIINAKIKFRNIQEPNEIQNFSNYFFSILINDFLKNIWKGNPVKKFLRYVIINRGTIERFNLSEIYNIRISEGCLGNCSFCAMKFSVIKHMSRPLDDIICEFKKGLKKGYKKFMLVARDSGSYGLDININIVKLLEEIFKIEGDYKIIINDFNVRWLIKYYKGLENLFEKNHKKIHRIVLAIQSGSNRILRLMNRLYKIEDVKKCLDDLKSKLPSFKTKISTQIMIGFPGETEEDFEKTVDLIKRLETPIVSIEGYSDRPNTQASKMDCKVDEAIIEKRISKLVKIRDSFR